MHESFAALAVEALTAHGLAEFKLGHYQDVFGIGRLRSVRLSLLPLKTGA